ncbi:rRNA adenine N-6-methyltransferase family protein [Vibrio splendidus]
MQRMDKKIYSEHWEKETDILDKQGVYQRLSEITPQENTVEVGCGIGLTSRYLASTRQVLSIENNEHLIEKSTSVLKDVETPPQIIHADIFELSDDVVALIEKFSPKVVVGWFIGSHADDIDMRTSNLLSITEKPKLYRENIEELIVTKIASNTSVEWVHLANRVGVSSEANKEDIIKATTDDYNTHVFVPNGFEIINIEILNWDRDGSDFMYVNASNPNFMGGNVIPRCISILAKRKQA